MADTARTQAEILALFADNTEGEISAQDARDFIVSVGAWSFPYNVVNYGAVGDGVTDETTAVYDAITAAGSTAPAKFPPGTYKVDTLTVTDSVIVEGGPGVVWAKNENPYAIEVVPTPVSGGNCNAATAGDTELVVTGAGWAGDEHVGKWVSVITAGANESIHRIASNTTDTLTLEQAIGDDVDAATAINLYTPIPKVHIRDVKFTNLVGGSGATVYLRYVDEVILERVEVNDSGGNSITIHNCQNVTVVDPVINDSGNFGIFVYNSDHVRVVRPQINGWAGLFGVQFKDCRDGQIISGTAISDGVTGDHGFQIKCSGLHAAFDCVIRDCYVRNTVKSGCEMSSLHNEATYHSSLNFRIEGCKVEGTKLSGYTMVADAAGTGYEPKGRWFVDCSSRDSTTGAGFYVPPNANGTQIIRPFATGALQEGIRIDADNCVVRGGILKDNSESVSATYKQELRCVDADNTLIEGVTFEHDGSSASTSVMAVRETGTSTYTIAKDCIIKDPDGEFTVDYNMTLTGSRAFGFADLDDFGAGSPTVNKTVYTTT